MSQTFQNLPCPIAREVSLLLNLSRENGHRAVVGGGTSSVGSGEADNQRSKRQTEGVRNRWLHDVMDVAEAVKAGNIDIVLDQNVSFFGRCSKSYYCSCACCSTGYGRVLILVVIILQFVRISPPVCVCWAFVAWQIFGNRGSALGSSAHTPSPQATPR